MIRNRWKRGDRLAICDRCGFTFYASQLRKEWTGFMVCPADWEERHPQDYLRAARGESRAQPWSRPEPGDTFTDVSFVDTGPGIGDMIIGATFFVR